MLYIYIYIVAVTLATEMAISKYRGTSMAARTGMLAMAVAMSCLWQERNTIIFSNVNRIKHTVL